jgi:hypothetical protein
MVMGIVRVWMAVLATAGLATSNSMNFSRKKWNVQPRVQFHDHLSLTISISLQQCVACPVGMAGFKVQNYTSFTFGRRPDGEVAWPAGWSSGCDGCASK